MRSTSPRIDPSAIRRTLMSLSAIDVSSSGMALRYMYSERSSATYITLPDLRPGASMLLMHDQTKLERPSYVANPVPSSVFQVSCPSTSSAFAITPLSLSTTSLNKTMPAEIPSVSSVSNPPYSRPYLFYPSLSSGTGGIFHIGSLPLLSQYWELRYVETSVSYLPAGELAATYCTI